MKTTTMPSLRVSPELRRQAESVLNDGETLSGFMIESLQESITRRLDQQAFLRRGLRSAATARRTGRYTDAGEVLDHLSSRLRAKKNLAPQG